MIIIRNIKYDEKNKEINIIFDFNNDIRPYSFGDDVFEILAKYNIKENTEIPAKVFIELRAEHFRHMLMKNIKDVDPASLTQANDNIEDFI